MVSLSMTLSEDVPMDASFFCNKAAVFSNKGHTTNLRSYLTVTNVKEFNKCIREGGVEEEGSTEKWQLSLELFNRILCKLHNSSCKTWIMKLASRPWKLIPWMA
jgi:hypothetical protein